MKEPGEREFAALGVAKAAHDVLRLGDLNLAQRLASIALEVSDRPSNVNSVMAGVLEARGQHCSAVRYWRRAVEGSPDNAEHRFNLALALLRQGELVEGLALHESRFDKQKWTSIALAGSLDGLGHRMLRPGDTLAGKRVLVLTEQGLGDCIWAARWLPALARSGAKLSLAARPALRPLLEPLAAFETILSPPDDRPDAKINLAAVAGRFDGFVPMMSLPWLLGVTTPEAGPVPWLTPDPREVAVWRRRFDTLLPNCRRILGLVWRANPDNQSGPVRSIPLAALRPIGGIAGHGVVSLQGGARWDRAAFPGLADGLPDGEVALASFAAALAATDRLITVDTMAMHLAGSIGHPTLVPVACAAPGFVLGAEQERCAWYPSLGLVRQGPDENWSGVADRLQKAVCCWR